MRNAPYTSVFVALLLGAAVPATAQEAWRPSQSVSAEQVSGQVSGTGKPEGRGSEARPWVLSVVTTLGRDVFSLPSKDTALTLGVGAALALAAHPADRRITQGVRASTFLDRTFEIGEPLGAGWTQVSGALGTFLVGHSIQNPRVTSLGADLVRAQAINGLLTQGLKVAVGRARPDGARFSFPSGHSSSTFATATVLQRHLGWKVGIPAYAAAGYVAASRLQENKHYPSDVIFGAAVGIIAGRTVTIGRGSGRFAMSPVVVPGGIGVAFARIATP